LKKDGRIHGISNDDTGRGNDGGGGGEGRRVRRKG
jgi:hypothetical protein